MALMNGDIKSREQSPLPAQYLGKRKRTVTPEQYERAEIKVAPARKILQDALELIKRYKHTAPLLNYPLPTHDNNGHMSKRQKTVKSDNEHNNIESRILNEEYDSLDDLISDVKGLKETVSRASPTTNGADTVGTIVTGQVEALLNLLFDLQSRDIGRTSPVPPTVNGNKPESSKPPVLPPNQVLSLRSQTEHGSRQLFSGLPKKADPINIDARSLPNGFELTEILSVDKPDVQSSRKFGDVFAPHRSIKTLEMPRSARSLRGTSVNFIPPYENITTPGRHDYKHTKLDSGLWLNYRVEENSNPDSRDQAKHDRKTTSTKALFKSVFSTFAPSIDNSQSVVSESERSQQWWQKYKSPTDSALVFTNTTALNDVSPNNDDKGFEEDMETIIANYISEDNEADNVDESNGLLDDISDLIQTLTSYQAMRNLEIAKGPSSASKPSKDEQEIYEVLRAQLQLLVSNLPPFAVAKLDGDQLEQLNVSTHLLVSTPEFVGTGQVDDYTLRRNRAAQAAASAVGRNTVSAQPRPTYSTPASAYNAQARAYNNVPSSAYSARPPTTTMYNTPRPTIPAQTAAYTQPPFRTGPMIHTPSVQQFQRPVVNGYGSAATPTPHSSYLQRPSQPAYQHRAQDAYARPDAVHKPLSNGEIPQYQHRQPTTTTISAQPQVTLDGMKQQQQGVDTSQMRTEVPSAITAGS